MNIAPCNNFLALIRKPHNRVTIGAANQKTTEIAMKK